MEKTRKTTEIEKNVMVYLNDLRDSGVTNMFGATPYICDEFDLDTNESMRILKLWMQNFNIECKYEEITE